MKSFKDKVAVITGAGSGMGRYLAVLLAKDGADVSVRDRDRLQDIPTGKRLQV